MYFYAIYTDFCMYVPMFLTIASTRPGVIFVMYKWSFDMILTMCLYVSLYEQYTILAYSILKMNTKWFYVVTRLILPLPNFFFDNMHSYAFHLCTLYVGRWQLWDSVVRWDTWAVSQSRFLTLWWTARYCDGETRVRAESADTLLCIFAPCRINWCVEALCACVLRLVPVYSWVVTLRLWQI